MTKQLSFTYLKNYTPPDFRIEKTQLHFDVHDSHTVVTAILHINRCTAGAPLILDGDALILEKLCINGKEITTPEYKITETHLILPTVPDQFILETRVKLLPKKNTQLMGLYQSRTNLCTQCESEGFRRITFYLDRPDVLSHFTTTISADKTKYPYLLSNGNFIEEKELGDNRHWVHWEDPSLKPCYLFALVAGDFDVLQDSFVTMTNKTVDLYLYLEKGFRDQGAYAMTAIKKSMKWDEEKFGREYDLNRFMVVAVSDFNMGAMENKGLNIFNTKYILAKSQTATDTDYINIERVIGHEYFHNWSGNRVTCRDWFQLTLKEGLTVLRDQLFTEDMTSKGVARIDVVNTLRNQQFTEDAGPMAHPIRPDSYLKIDNFYTSTVYEKGAEVIRMVRTLLSPDIFRKGMDLYFSRYDGQAVTTEDFLAAMTEASGKELSQFSRWYHQAGTPVLRVKTHYDSAKKTLDVTIKQTCPSTPGQEDKLPFHMPFAMGLVGNNCCDLPLQLTGESIAAKTTCVIEIKKPEETVTFTNVNENPVPSLLRHFSAPVELQYDYTNQQLAHLWQCDSDAFSRFEAGQRLLVHLIEINAKEITRGKTPTVDPLLICCVDKLLTQNIEDPSLFSRLLTFPSLRYVLSHMPTMELTVVHAAKQLLENTLAMHFEKQWLALYKRYQVSGEYTYNIADCGYRRLNNLCLYYLLKTQNRNYIEMAYSQATKADNMTDQWGALIALNDHDIAPRTEALTHFYDKYQHEPLVVNKWFALQASTLLPQAINDVKKLLHHPAFDINNPNNVYALLVTFGDNTLRFHEKNGDGYKLLTDQVLLIDAINPQVAARVVRPLTQWKQMDPARSVLMKIELMRMRNASLSDNLCEIVNKSLL